MRRALLASCTALVLLTVPASSQDFSVYLTPLVSFDSYNALDLGPGMNIGASVTVDIAGPLRITGAALFGTRTASYDLIGRTGHVDVRTGTYAGSVSFRVLGSREGGELAAVLGGGAVVSSVDPMTVPAGGLGVVTIPGREETRGYIALGFSGALPLSSRVAITCDPALRFMTPLSSAPADYAISGGIRVALF
jgi:hypothetical protein